MPTKKFDEYLGKRADERDPDASAAFDVASAHFAQVERGLGIGHQLAVKLRNRLSRNSRRCPPRSEEG